jgi:hypothetical protein
MNGRHLARVQNVFSATTGSVVRDPSCRLVPEHRQRGLVEGEYVAVLVEEQHAFLQMIDQGGKAGQADHGHAALLEEAENVQQLTRALTLNVDVCNARRPPPEILTINNNGLIMWHDSSNESNKDREPMGYKPLAP